MRERQHKNTRASTKARHRRPPKKDCQARRNGTRGRQSRVKSAVGAVQPPSSQAGRVGGRLVQDTARKTYSRARHLSQDKLVLIVAGTGLRTRFIMSPGRHILCVVRPMTSIWSEGAGLPLNRLEPAANSSALPDIRPVLSARGVGRQLPARADGMAGTKFEPH